MIHGWNGSTLLPEANPWQVDAANEPRVPRQQPEEPKDDFVFRSYSIDGVRYCELGSRFITVVKLMLVALIFAGTFVVLSKAIDRVEATGTEESVDAGR